MKLNRSPVNARDGLSRYVQRIRAYPILSPEFAGLAAESLPQAPPATVTGRWQSQRSIDSGN
jgi:hypothetical protein